MKFILIPAFILIGLEVILYSLGILIYHQNLFTEEYAGIQRISTTVGAATGTGVVLFMLGALVLQLYVKKKAHQYLFLVFWIITCFYTISRGAILCLILYVVVFIFNELKEKNFISKILFTLFFAALIIGLYNNNVFEPILERQKELEQSDRIMTGRDIRFATTIQIFTESPLYGVGCGNIFPAKDIQNATFIPFFQVAPHNYWLLTLGEQGIIGFFLLFWMFCIIIRRLDYKKYSSYAVILTTLILFNTETVFTGDEYMPLLFLLIIISITPTTRCTTLRE